MRNNFCSIPTKFVLLKSMSLISIFIYSLCHFIVAILSYHFIVARLSYEPIKSLFIPKLVFLLTCSAPSRDRSRYEKGNGIHHRLLVTRRVSWGAARDPDHGTLPRALSDVLPPSPREADWRICSQIVWIYLTANGQRCQANPSMTKAENTPDLAGNCQKIAIFLKTIFECFKVF